MDIETDHLGEPLSSNQWSLDLQIVDVLDWLERNYPAGYAEVREAFPEEIRLDGSHFDIEAMGVEADYSSWLAEAIEATGLVGWYEGEPFAVRQPETVSAYVSLWDAVPHDGDTAFLVEVTTRRGSRVATRLEVQTRPPRLNGSGRIALPDTWLGDFSSPDGTQITRTSRGRIRVVEYTGLVIGKMIQETDEEYLIVAQEIAEMEEMS